MEAANTSWHNFLFRLDWRNELRKKGSTYISSWIWLMMMIFKWNILYLFCYETLLSKGCAKKLFIFWSFSSLRNFKIEKWFLYSPLVGHPGEYFDTFPGWYQYFPGCYIPPGKVLILGVQYFPGCYMIVFFTWNQRGSYYLKYFYVKLPTKAL